MIEQAKKVLRIEADAIAALIDRIDERFEQAVTDDPELQRPCRRNRHG